MTWYRATFEAVYQADTDEDAHEHALAIAKAVHAAPEPFVKAVVTAGVEVMSDSEVVEVFS